MIGVTLATMTAFPQPPPDEGAVVSLEETDKALPKILNPGTRYAYFKTIARGGKCIIQSCKDLHLGRTICYKKLLPEFEDDDTLEDEDDDFDVVVLRVAPGITFE